MSTSTSRKPTSPTRPTPPSQPLRPDTPQRKRPRPHSIQWHRRRGRARSCARPRNPRCVCVRVGACVRWYVVGSRVVQRVSGVSNSHPHTTTHTHVGHADALYGLRPHLSPRAQPCATRAPPQTQAQGPSYWVYQSTSFFASYPSLVIAFFPFKCSTICFCPAACRRQTQSGRRV
jgi:hypothetical protein